MADSTHTHPKTRRWRTLPALLGALAIASLASGSFPAPTLADGDPASDVLVAQPLFLPQDAGLTADQQAQLGALLSAARRSGYPLRVAIIASPADLGSITELWRQPESYARFLGQELALVYHGTLLVVMPNGYGLYGPGSRAQTQRPALAQPGSATVGPGLGTSAISAVTRLAAAAGHPLHVSTVSAAAAATQTDYVAVAAFAVGAVLIALAWTASLRARPLGSRPEPLQ